MQSQQQLKKMLVAHGCTAIQFISQPPQEGFAAIVPIEGATYTIRVEAICKKAGNREQEERRVWRVFFYHMKAIFESADSGVMQFKRMVLPYIVTRSGLTIGESILPRLKEAVESNPARMLGQTKGE